MITRFGVFGNLNSGSPFPVCVGLRRLLNMGVKARLKTPGAVNIQVYNRRMLEKFLTSNPAVLKTQGT
jgi:hypothetical protein